MERAKAFSPYRRSQRLSWLIAVWHSLELTRSSQDRRLNPARRIRLYCANLTGGLASHLLVRRIGLKWGRCGLGMLGLAVAACCTTAVVFTHSPTVALALLSVTYGAITLQQPIMFAVCLDIGGFYAGAMVGAMNMASHSVGFWAHWYSDTSWPAPAAATMWRSSPRLPCSCWEPGFGSGSSPLNHSPPSRNP